MDNKRSQSDKQQKQSKRSILMRKLRKPKTLLSMLNIGSIAYKAGKWVIENLIDFSKDF